MGWSIGYDERWKRDVGYGVPAVCDHPDCEEVIDRGLSYVCGEEPFGGEHGCGLFFCGEHMALGRLEGDAPVWKMRCDRCRKGWPTFEPKPDTRQWLEWKMYDGSWMRWRQEHPEEVAKIREVLANS